MALGTRLKATEGRFLVIELRRQLANLERHLDRLAKRIEHCIKTDPQLTTRANILRSIPGIGPLVSAALLCGLSEMGNCSGKAASLLAGLAPIADDSGNRQGKRHIAGGRQQVRNALYMAALAAIRHNPGLKDFYRRLIERGKATKLAITAVMRKLVVLANSLITQNRNWTPYPPKQP